MNSAQRKILQARYERAKKERWGIWGGFVLGIAIALVYKFMFSRYAIDVFDIVWFFIWFCVCSWWDSNKRREIEDLEYRLARPMTKKEKKYFEKKVWPEIKKSFKKK